MHDRILFFFVFVFSCCNSTFCECVNGGLILFIVTPSALCSGFVPAPAVPSFRVPGPNPDR